MSFGYLPVMPKGGKERQPLAYENDATLLLVLVVFLVLDSLLGRARPAPGCLRKNRARPNACALERKTLFSRTRTTTKDKYEFPLFGVPISPCTIDPHEP